jgi:hypothetical protein
MHEPEEESVTIAVMLGKIEVRLSQVLEMLIEHGKFFDEVWTRLREVERDNAATAEWKRVQDVEQARRPGWVSIVSAIVAIASLLFAVGIIGTKGI